MVDPPVSVPLTLGFEGLETVIAFERQCYVVGGPVNGELSIDPFSVFWKAAVGGLRILCDKML